MKQKESPPFVINTDLIDCKGSQWDLKWIIFLGLCNKKQSDFSKEIMLATLLSPKLWQKPLENSIIFANKIIDITYVLLK